MNASRTARNTLSDEWPEGSLRVESIPADMRAMPQWVLWKYEQRECGDKPTKVPYNPRNRRGASSTDQSTWGTFDEAIKAYYRGGFTGIGFMFASGFFGIDIDGCRDPITGQIDPLALEIVREFASYTEISPSKKGLHIIGKGILLGDGIKRTVCGLTIEIYSQARYFTVTADPLEGTPTTVNERQTELETRYRWVIKQSEAERQAKQKAKGNGSREKVDRNARGTILTDAEVMEKALNAENGAKFEQLYYGDISEYGGDKSRADMAFASMLCFWTQDDLQVERLWKESKLYRKKLERGDYIHRTIDTARSNQTANYSANYKPNSDGSLSNGKPKASRELTGREQIICRMMAHWGISDESFRVYIAVRGIINKRKTARIAGALIGRHIRVKEEGKAETKEEAYALDKRFGNRRMTNLLDELKASVKYPILKRVEKGGKMLPSGKRQAAKYHLNEVPFDEAEEIAAKHPAMISGSPDYNPGRTREEAALEVARKYSKNSEPEQPSGPPKPDAFTVWIKAEKALFREAQKIADAWDDLSKTTGERLDFANKLAEELKQILLSQISRNLRHKRKKKEIFTGN